MKRLIRNSRVFIFLVVLTLVGVVGTISIVYASNQSDSTVYRVCVDQRGNMRLLGPDIKGNYGDECKQNEFMIELPSNTRVSELIAELEAELVAKLNELGDNVTDVKVTISVLESIVSEQGGKIIELEGVDTEHADSITALWERLAGLEGIVNEQADNITALWDRIAELEGNSGNSSGNGNNHDGIVTEGLVLYLPLWKLEGNPIISEDDYSHLCTATVTPWTLEGRLFDGAGDNAYITLPTLTYGTSFTLIVSAKADSLAASRYLVGRNVRIAFWVSTTGYIQINIGDGAWGTNFNSAAGEVVVNQWFQAAATSNGARTELYNNGLHLGGATNTKDVGSQVCEVGRNASTGDLEFSGLIAEVWVYNRALTPLEIQQNYLATKQRYE